MSQQRLSFLTLVAESLLTTGLMTPAGTFCDYASSRYQTRMPASAVPIVRRPLLLLVTFLCIRVGQHKRNKVTKRRFIWETGGECALCSCVY